MSSDEFRKHINAILVQMLATPTLLPLTCFLTLLLFDAREDVPHVSLCFTCLLLQKLSWGEEQG